MHRVAIKTYQKDRFADYHLYMEREIEILQKLSHPNLQQFHSIMETRINYHIILELCSGQSLKQLINRNQLFSESIAKPVFF
jgi:serine/threonine protein kinase